MRRITTHYAYLCCISFLTASLLTGCGSGSNSSNAANTNNTARFAETNYDNSTVDDTSLTGTWLILGDLSYREDNSSQPLISSIRNIEFDIAYRNTINIVDNQDGTIFISNCYSNPGDSDNSAVTQLLDISSNSLQIAQGPVDFVGNIVSNTRIEGSFQSSNSQISEIVGSATMIKISDNSVLPISNNNSLGEFSLAFPLSDPGIQNIDTNAPPTTLPRLAAHCLLDSNASIEGQANGMDISGDFLTLKVVSYSNDANNNAATPAAGSIANVSATIGNGPFSAEDFIVVAQHTLSDTLFLADALPSINDFSSIGIDTITGGGGGTDEDNYRANGDPVDVIFSLALDLELSQL